ncbi:type IV secretion system DNA-binding domain-containing protein [Candidatus Parcubacteria bacterium]|jgi:CxxC-x17-CxxC domain-containing protein|nr:type IV secretion system DNA-binding domain-containing protein [Candidatus Parcubacteria bacterium]
MARENDITIFSQTNYRNSNIKFGIKTDDRRRHMYFIGKTGMGKSTVLENMIIQDIQAGKGVCVVDPHGDLVEKVLDFIPAHRINETIYFNPADLSYPIGFNVLETVDIEQRHLVVSGLIGVFKKIWADSWGPRLEYVLHHAISALLEYPGSTLLGIMRMLTDKAFRKRVIDKVTDPVVKAFWVDEYSKYPDRFQAEAIAPIQNKVGRFLSSALIRNILGQVRSSFSMRDIMDQQKILLLNLSKGRVGEDNSALLGAMMITKIQLAAMSRVDTPEAERKDFYLYVDEFQNFATESFANILSEARKYRLNLVIAHQYVEQLVDEVRAAVFGNVGTIVAFRVGAADAEFLEKEFFPTFTQEDLVNLSKYEIYLKLMIDGVTSEAFSAATLPPVIVDEADINAGAKVIKVTRERYSKPREVIEDKIIRWSESKGSEDEQKKAAPAAGGKDFKKTTPAKKFEKSRPAVKSKDVTCSFCGKDTKVNFDPDPTRPIYCRECLDLSKAGKIPAPSTIKVSAKPVAAPNSEPKKEKEEFVSLAEAMSFKPRPAPTPIKQKEDKPTQPKNKKIPEQANKSKNNKPTKTEPDNTVINPGQVVKL